MRGFLNHPVECKRCHRPTAAPKDQLCNFCRPIVAPNSRVKYDWTEAQLDELRLAWRSVGNRKKLSAAITLAQKRIGFPRYILRLKAGALGLTVDTRRPWTKDEVSYLESSAGMRPVKEMARHLHREYYCVQSKLCALGFSGRVTKGYTREDLTICLGVSHQLLSRWMSDGHFEVRDDRVTEASVVRFVHRHPELYSLRRVDEHWIKAILFPRAPVYRAPLGERHAGEVRA